MASLCFLDVFYYSLDACITLWPHVKCATITVCGRFHSLLFIFAVFDFSYNIDCLKHQLTALNVVCDLWSQL